jgi:hypothetical protein
MMEDLNSQIAKLSEDYKRQQELNAIRSKLSEDKQHSNYNNKIQELRGFNPLSVQPHPQEQLLKRIAQPVTTNDNFLSTRNTRFEIENRVEGDGVGKLEAIQKEYQSREMDTRHNHNSPLLQQNNMPRNNNPSNNKGIQPGNIDTYNNIAKPNGNSINGMESSNSNKMQMPSYTREDMNARMDTFRFDNSTFQRGSLVPVNMDHYYSGNLFAEGNPVPEDLRNEYTPGQRQHPNGRVHYQEKSKTIYKDEFNARLSALSPLSRTLFYPAAEQGQQQTNGTGVSGITQQQQTINTMQPMHNINNRRQELNNRMSQHMPLSSAMALPAEYADPTKLGTGLPQQYTTQNTNLMPGQPKKVAYNTIYPVSSN